MGEPGYLASATSLPLHPTPRGFIRVFSTSWHPTCKSHPPLPNRLQFEQHLSAVEDIYGRSATYVNMVETVTAYKFRAATSIFEYQRVYNWNCPSLFSVNPGNLQQIFPKVKIKAPNCASNPRSTGFRAFNYADKEDVWSGRRYRGEEFSHRRISDLYCEKCAETTAEIIQEESQKPARICADDDANGWEEGIPADEVKMVAKFRSKYNYIRVLEVSRRADHPLAGARLLLLDKPGNIHSVHFKYKFLTNTYYDVFATLPPLLPHGTLGILGMGAGTAAHLLFHFWPSIEIHGWELDPSVISFGRKYFGLFELERANPGKIVVHIGDALKASVPGGFSGIVVDLFSEGAVIPELQRPSTWQSLKARLKHGGRIMVNCGGSCVEAENPSKDGHMVMQETVGALAEAFPGETFMTTLGFHKDDSCIALTGPLPDLDAWKKALPPCLKYYVSRWVPVRDSNSI